MAEKGRDNTANDVLNPRVSNLIRKIEKMLGVTKLFSEKDSTGSVTRLGKLRYSIMRLTPLFDNGDIYYDGRKIVVKNTSSVPRNIDQLNSELRKLPSHQAKKVIKDSRTVLTFREEVQKGYRVIPSTPSY